MPAVKTLSIPVYPLVEKFLTSQFGSDPFLLSAYSNPYSGFLYNSLDRYGYTDAKMPKKYGFLTASLTVAIPTWVVRHGAGGKLTPQKISVFNDFVLQLFFEKMTTEVALRMSLGAGLRMSIERFMNRYGITEEELSLDRALRYYARYRRHLLGHEVSLTDCCPDFPAGPGPILPHDGDRTIGQVESRGRQMA